MTEKELTLAELQSITNEIYRLFSRLPRHDDIYSDLALVRHILGEYEYRIVSKQIKVTPINKEIKPVTVSEMIEKLYENTEKAETATSPSVRSAAIAAFLKKS